jgi:hypothetical protein
MAIDHSWQALLNPGGTDVFFNAHRPARLDGEAGGFSPVNAWWLSELCRLIYKKDRTEGVDCAFSRNDHLARVGLAERRFFNREQIQAALVETTSTSRSACGVLVFRGTAGHLSNWRFNVDIVPTAWAAGGMVHRGFQKLLKVVWEAIDTALDTVDGPVFYTGHSMGGAMATLAASLRPPQAVYTFGAPRIGDAAFAETLRGTPVFNVINARDIVTGLPPAGRWSRFVHAGVIVKNAHASAPERRLAQAPALLADHAPVNYTAQLPVAFGT